MFTIPMSQCPEEKRLHCIIFYFFLLTCFAFEETFQNPKNREKKIHYSLIKNVACQRISDNTDNTGQAIPLLCVTS